MYIAVTGSKNNKDIYIYQSFRKKDGKSSSSIYKKLGKYNTLLEQFDGDNEKLMAWAKSEAAKETDLYNERTGKVTVEFSQASYKYERMIFRLFFGMIDKCKYLYYFYYL